MRHRLLAFALVAAPLSAAHACVCSSGSTQTALRQAEAVFRGRAIAFRPSFVQPRSVEITRFRVDRVWKGDVPAEVTLAMYHWSDCGGDFPDDGSEWIVFAFRDDRGRLTTSACSGTTLVSTRYPYVRVPGHELTPPESLAMLPDSAFRVLDTTRATDFLPAARMLAELGPGRPPSGPVEPDPWPAIVGWSTASFMVLLAWSLVHRWRSRRPVA